MCCVHFPIADRFMLHAAMLLAFHGCLRCGEFTTPVNYHHRRHASRGDVTMDSEGMQFQLKTSKTDPYGKGTTIEVGLWKPPMCATTAIRTYLTMTNRMTLSSATRTVVRYPRRLLWTRSGVSWSLHRLTTHRATAATHFESARQPRRRWQVPQTGRSPHWDDGKATLCYATFATIPQP